VSNARIVLSFKIDGHEMGEEIETAGKPHISIEVQGTDTMRDVTIIRNGSTLYSLKPGRHRVTFEYTDSTFAEDSYYYLRVVQADTDEYGNPSRAWSSPVWVKRR